jgi:hypothetical protein
MTDCTDKSALSSGVIDPGKNDSIIWQVIMYFITAKGAELYHFRIQLVERTYCNLSTEFIVYVYNEPLSIGKEWLTLCLSGIFFGFMLLLGYVYKNYMG